jgi:hypothetical protein
MYTTSIASPGTVALKTGVLDGGALDKYGPAVELNAESRTPWLTTQEGVVVFDTMPPGA